MRAWAGGAVFTSIVMLYACVGEDPKSSPGPADAGDGVEAGGLDGRAPDLQPDAAPVTPGLTVTATPRVFVPPNVATDVAITVTRTALEGAVKIEIDKLPDGVTADSAPVLVAGQTTAVIRLSTSSSAQRFARAKITATLEGATPVTVSTDVEVTVRGRSGEADTTFGLAGVVDLASSSVGESITDATTDHEGRIYLLLPDLGDAARCRVFRTTPNGAVDASGWGTNGIVDLRRSNGAPLFCGRLALQADGKVLVGGSDLVDGVESVAWVARVSGLATTGSFLDPTYGSGGFALADGASVNDLAVDTQGRALVSGSVVSGRYLKRITANGAVDGTFTATSPLIGSLTGNLLATAAGAIYGTPNGGSDIFRLGETGTLDITFGNAGRLAVPKPVGASETELAGLRLDSRGRIVGLGKTELDSGEAGIVIRLDGEQPDPAFGPNGDGLAYVAGPRNLRYLEAVIDETDGIIAASSEQYSEQDARVVLTRFVDGTVDSVFSPGGIRSLPPMGGIAEVRGMVLQEQRLLVLLFVQIDGTFHPILTRLWR